jgi:hypothetical protein
LLLPLLFKKSGAKILKIAYIKKALPMFQPIFRPESLRLLSLDWFLNRDNTAVHTTTCVQDFKRQQWRNDDQPHALLPDIAPADFFPYRRKKIDGAGRHLIVPVEPQDVL